ncbi:MAG: hypothetical protein GY701_07195 [Sulfitobacter sp.]|nr:hypothetical protein [Sulfitobacter sp.]
MDEIDAIQAAEEAYLRGVPVLGGRFVADSCDLVSETWVVRWNVHREDGSMLRDDGYTTLVSAAGRTRLSWVPRPVADAVADFEADHEPVGGEDRLPEGWTLERIKDMGIPAPAIVTRPVTVLSDRVDGPVELAAVVILDLGGYCLVLTDDSDGWHMGQWTDADMIACWGSYGPDLEYAINSL